VLLSPARQGADDAEQARAEIGQRVARRRSLDEPVALEVAGEMIGNQNTSPVDGVVATIVNALSSDNPEARCVVGRDASRLVMLRRLPRGLRDRLLMNTVGLKPDVFETNCDMRKPAAA
jgi:hypothetical protein